ncbi:MAG: DUF2786 domain-containing protein [Nocardiopsaceae bacterium]|nr:DUF2786 domain-containing protein [Nocardiopsaceae bacterium]
MRTTVPDDLLDRVRKLLAKAEGEGVTPAEAEALTAKAAELMARYGIDRARLGALHPETDQLADRVFDLDNPWASVKAHLLAGLAMALRCQCVLLSRPVPGSRVHVFGYSSDLERADILFTSLLVQMARALAVQPVPASGGRAKAWRRSWMLGYCTAVTGRVREAEEAAAVRCDHDDPQADSGPSTALVLADRALAVRHRAEQAYPRTRKTRVTYSGSGYRDGYAQGQKADIGSTKIRSRPAGALRR